MNGIVSIKNLSKIYKSGLAALKDVSLDIKRGEILALLGPNGAGKTTLISTICGIVTKSSGTITVDGHDTISDFRAARSLIGLVPQELHLSIFETTWDTVKFSRTLFGKSRDDAYLEEVLRKLTLWDKKDARIVTLSGGMKRRVLIAKALAHQPQILFLDEPTAGVDVELRKEMWQIVRDLRATGVTVILTTHYIEEAEEMADRVGVINKGELILVEEKAKLMQQLGKKKLTLQLGEAMNGLTPSLAQRGLSLSPSGRELVYRYDGHAVDGVIPKLLAELSAAGVTIADLHTEQSSLEDIFIGLVKQ